LNPSTADAERDDPTIRKCVGFARTWGFGGVEVVNLFAYRATLPCEMRLAADPIGPTNDSHILDVAARCRPVVAAWGTHGDFLGRSRAVLDLLATLGTHVECLGTTRSGHPRHPLYVRYDTPLVPYGL
jgi:hypothetical protein